MEVNDMKRFVMATNDSLEAHIKLWVYWEMQKIFANLRNSSRLRSTITGTQLTTDWLIHVKFNGLFTFTDPDFDSILVLGSSGWNHLAVQKVLHSANNVSI